MALAQRAFVFLVVLAAVLTLGLIAGVATAQEPKEALEELTGVKVGEKADEYGGQAFITEYAAPTRELVVTHPLLQQLARSHPYVLASPGHRGPAPHNGGA